MSFPTRLSTNDAMLCLTLSIPFPCFAYVLTNVWKLLDNNLTLHWGWGSSAWGLIYSVAFFRIFLVLTPKNTILPAVLLPAVFSKLECIRCRFVFNYRFTFNSQCNITKVYLKTKDVILYSIALRWSMFIKWICQKHMQTVKICPSSKRVKLRVVKHSNFDNSLHVLKCILHCVYISYGVNKGTDT